MTTEELLLHFDGVQRTSRGYQDRLGVHYRAYYIRKGDKCWGYYVDPSQSYYLTWEAAKAARETHLNEHDVKIASR